MREKINTKNSYLILSGGLLLLFIRLSNEIIESIIESLLSSNRIDIFFSRIYTIILRIVVFVLIIFIAKKLIRNTNTNKYLKRSVFLLLSFYISLKIIFQAVYSYASFFQTSLSENTSEEFFIIMANINGFSYIMMFILLIIYLIRGR